MIIRRPGVIAGTRQFLSSINSKTASKTLRAALAFASNVIAQGLAWWTAPYSGATIQELGALLHQERFKLDE